MLFKAYLVLGWHTVILDAAGGLTFEAVDGPSLEQMRIRVGEESVLVTYPDTTRNCEFFAVRSPAGLGLAKEVPTLLACGNLPLWITVSVLKG